MVSSRRKPRPGRATGCACVAWFCSAPGGARACRARGGVRHPPLPVIRAPCSKRRARGCFR
eukprot:11214078-Lingulodinium_polyedra.AAC.1